MAGEPFKLGSPAEADHVGLRFVHQDLGVVLTLSVAENLMLGRPYPVRMGCRVRWSEVRSIATSALDELGVDVDVTEPVSRLSLAERTAVAIARALAGNEGKRIIAVLDEPTAALPPTDVKRLLAIVERLKESGNGVLLVSHHLDEVLQIADRVSVLRDGLLVGTTVRSDLNRGRVVEMILGRPIDVPEPGVAHVEPEGTPVRLEVSGVAGGRITEVDFGVHAGEIVGFAGITGSGRESLVPLLTGRLPREGAITVDGRVIPPEDPKAALKLGVASIPGERAQFGNFPNFNVRKNITISDMNPLRRMGRILMNQERHEVDDWIAKLGIVTLDCEAAIGSLSGGNQQKVLVARALRLNPRLLILDDPTLGVDVGAKAQIHAIITKYASQGMAVVVVSTDSEELATLCDVVHIFGHGRLVERMKKGDELSASSIDRAQLMSSEQDSRV